MEEIDIEIETSINKDGLCEAVFFVDAENIMGPTITRFKAEDRKELAKQVADYVFKVLSGTVSGVQG